MTVQELIDELMKIDDKNRIVEVPMMTSDNWCGEVGEVVLDGDKLVLIFCS